jgi:hypothetical protein
MEETALFVSSLILPIISTNHSLENKGAKSIRDQHAGIAGFMLNPIIAFIFHAKSFPNRHRPACGGERIAKLCANCSFASRRRWKSSMC